LVSAPESGSDQSSEPESARALEQVSPLGWAREWAPESEPESAQVSEPESEPESARVWAPESEQASEPEWAEVSALAQVVSAQVWVRRVRRWVSAQVSELESVTVSAPVSVFERQKVRSSQWQWK
jgi:hypothetical protein